MPLLVKLTDSEVKAGDGMVPQFRNRCESDTGTVFLARHAILCARAPRSGAAAVSCGCPELSDGSDSAGNFAVRVKARQFGQWT